MFKGSVRGRWPLAGCGVGLRHTHYSAILDGSPRVDWFEAVTENYMDSGGRPVQILERIRGRYPVALHGTALSIGSSDPLDAGYLKSLKVLADRIDPFIVSDHICWSGVENASLHDLLPMPFTEESVRHVVRRVDRVQNLLRRRILLENVSTYVTYRHSTMPEWEFVREVARRSGCGILCDINNIYVNSVNHGFDPLEYIAALDGWVGQIHLAGHTDMGAYLFDTHSAPVIDRVWDLYRAALARWGKVSTLIEWDENIPAFEVLVAEAAKARKIYEKAPDRVILRPRSRPKNDMGVAKSRDVKLRQVQREFRLSMRPDAAPSARAAKFLNPQGGSPGADRLSIYAGGYVARLREAIAEVYEAVRKVIGEHAFTHLAHDYALRHGSEHYNLNLAGSYLPDFLAKSGWASKFPFLPDLARFEWAVWEAFHAFEEASMKPEALSRVPLERWERARIVFQPSVRLVRSEWAVLDLWTGRETEQDFAAIAARGPQDVLVGRKGDQVRCEALDPGRFSLISALLRRKTLGSALSELAKKSGDGEIPVAAWFSNWVNDGLIVRCEFTPERLRPLRRSRKNSKATAGTRR